MFLEWHQVELSGVKVQQKELKDQRGVVVSRLGWFSSLAIKKHGNLGHGLRVELTGVQLVQRRVSQQFAESHQDNEAALNEAACRSC